MHKCLSHRLYELKAIHQAVSYSIKPICILKTYQFILLVQEFPVKPPKMFPPLFTTVTVGPLSSHLEWNAKAANPSREARNSKRHSLFIGNQVFKTLRCSSFVSITDSSNSFFSVRCSSGKERKLTRVNAQMPVTQAIRIQGHSSGGE